MIGHIQASTGTAFARRRPLTGEAFDTSVKLSSFSARLAGGLLLTRLQLAGGEYESNLNCALPLVREQLLDGKHPGYTGLNQNNSWSVDHRREPAVSNRKLREAYKKFLPVAHLWATLVYSGQHGRVDIWPGSNEWLPTFLAFADSILEMASALPEPNREHRFALTRQEAWTFVIPRHLCQHRPLLALPLDDLQLRAYQRARRL
jgi:hypothetical protein